MSSKIDHKFTDEIVCPHCGEEWQDSWEMDESGACDCDACDGQFYFNRIVTVEYSTEKIFCKKDGHKWRNPQSLWFDEGKGNLWRRRCSECDRSEQGYDPEWKPE